VGVVSDIEYTYAYDGLRNTLPHFDGSRIRIQIIPCGDKSVYLPYRLLTWLQHQHQLGGLSDSATTTTTATATTHSSSSKHQELHTFDYVYYTEADNVLHMRDHDGVATTLIAFLDDSTYGRSSFIAPQRYETGRGSIIMHNRNG